MEPSSSVKQNHRTGQKNQNEKSFSKFSHASISPTPNSSSSIKRGNNNGRLISAKSTTSSSSSSSSSCSSSTTTTSTKNYEIKWNDYPFVLQNVFRRVMLSQQFSDVTLSCDGESFRCHRVLLAACSSLFEKLLNQLPGSDLVIHMKGMKTWELQAVIDFMYSGKVNVSENQLDDFFQAAEACKINGLDIPSTRAKNSLETDESNSRATYNKNYTGAAKANKGVHNAKTEISSNFVPSQVSLPQNKRKIMNSSPRLFKMPKLNPSTTQHHFGTFSGGKYSSLKTLSNTHPDDADILEFEREGLAQLLSNENYENVDGMSPTEMSDDEEVQQDVNYPDDGDGATQGQVRDYNDRDQGQEEKQAYHNNGEHANDGNMAETLEAGSSDDRASVDERTLQPLRGNSERGADMQSTVKPLLNRHRRYATTPRAHNSRTYSTQLQDAAFDALRNGMSNRQCSELLGISRKTLSKWKNNGLHLHDNLNSPNTDPKLPKVLNEQSVAAIQKSAPPTKSMRGVRRACDERNKAFENATKMVLSGVTCLQAAAHFNIPRTSLTTYMKRQGSGVNRGTRASSSKIISRSNQDSSNQHKDVVGSTIVTKVPSSEPDQELRINQTTYNYSPPDLNDDDEFPFLGLTDFIQQFSEQQFTG